MSSRKALRVFRVKLSLLPVFTFSLQCTRLLPLTQCVRWTPLPLLTRSTSPFTNWIYLLPVTHASLSTFHVNQVKWCKWQDNNSTHSPLSMFECNEEEKNNLLSMKSHFTHSLTHPLYLSVCVSSVGRWEAIVNRGTQVIKLNWIIFSLFFTCDFPLLPFTQWIYSSHSIAA